MREANPRNVFRRRREETLLELFPLDFAYYLQGMNIQAGGNEERRSIKRMGRNLMMREESLLRRKKNGHKSAPFTKEKVAKLRIFHYEVVQ